MNVIKRTETTNHPILGVSASILREEKRGDSPVLYESANSIVSRREWMRAGLRSAVLLGLGAMVFFLSRRTGQTISCNRAGCRNCPLLTNCQGALTTSVQRADNLLSNEGLEL